MAYTQSYSSHSFVVSSGQASRRVKNPAFNPLYRQTKKLILQALSKGDWMSGMMIPSEAELAAQFGVSQGTVRRAVDELSAENLLVRLQGKGTFVASHSDTPYSFLRLRPNNGGAPQRHSRPLSCESVAANEKVADALAISVNDPVMKVERILLFNGEATVFDQIFLSMDSFGGLSLDMLCQEQHTLYSVLEWRFGVRVIRAEEKLRAVAAEAGVAKTLALPVGEPVLLIERTAYTYGNKAIEWRHSFYRTDYYHYFNELD